MKKKNIHIDVEFALSREEVLIEDALAHPFELLPGLPNQTWHLVVVPTSDDRTDNDEWKSYREKHIDFLTQLVVHLNSLSNQKLKSLNKEASRYESDFQIDEKKYRFRWEEHISFFTYTFFTFGEEIKVVPKVVLDFWTNKGEQNHLKIPGKLLCAFDVRVREDRLSIEEIGEILHAKNGVLFGSSVFNNLAEVWSELRSSKLLSSDYVDAPWISLEKNGVFNRTLILHRTPLLQKDNRSFRQNIREVGRLLDTVLDLETYRALSSFDLPERDVRDLINELDILESEVRNIAEKTGNAGNPYQYCKRMHKVADKWNHLQMLAAKYRRRVAATRAYDSLICNYLEILQEKPISGMNTTMFGTLIKKRVLRSKHACEAISERINSLSDSIDTLSDLLRTRIDISFQFMALPVAVGGLTYAIASVMQMYSSNEYLRTPIIFISSVSLFIYVFGAWAYTSLTRVKKVDK